MHKLSAALLEREMLDADEIKLIIDGKDLPPFDAGFRGSDEDLQKVLKPEGTRAPGFNEGQPSHA
jgi:cell division protease FtsH